MWVEGNIERLACLAASRLEGALLDEASTPTQLSAALRPVMAAVEVDYVNGSLKFQWRRSERRIRITYAMPRDD